VLSKLWFYRKSVKLFSLNFIKLRGRGPCLTAKITRVILSILKREHFSALYYNSKAIFLTRY
jgi:hypothetical protein